MPLRNLRKGMDFRFGELDITESRTASRTITVGVPSEYASVSAALDEIRQIRPSPGLFFTVNIETGHALQERIHIENEVLPHVSITSTDATVPIVDTFPAGARLFTVRNAVAPRLGVVFDGLSGGTNHGAEGIMVDRNATLRIDGGGAINCWRGAEPHRNAFVYCSGARFDGNTQRGISATRNAQVYLESDCQAIDNGDYNVRVGGTGVVNANSNVTFTGGGEGIHVSSNGRMRAQGADVSNCGMGVNADGGRLTLDGLVANGCTGDAVRINDAYVDIGGATIGSPGQIGIHNQGGGGVVNAAGASVTTSTGNGVRIASPMVANFSKASITGSGGQGVMARSGAHVSLQDATVTGSTNNDINIGWGSIVSAEGCDTSASVGGAPHSADVNVAFNSVSGKGIVFAETFE